MDGKIYECLQCSEKLGLSDRPVMTIRKGKAMYYCQACWKLSKDNKSANNSPLMQQKKFSSGPAAAKVNSGMPATPSAAPKTTTTISTKATTVTKTNTAHPQVAASATGRQIVPNGGGATKKVEPKKDVVLCPKSGAAGTQDEELKPLKPSVPGGVTTNLLKNAKDEEDLAAITAQKLKIEQELKDKLEEEVKDCFVCEQPVSGTYYTCGEWQYHEKCITCSSCGKKDREQWEDCVILPNEDEGGKGVLFFCKKCNLANAPVCWKCEKPIMDGALSVSGSDGTNKTYHSSCLNCGLCGSNMAQGEDLIYVNGVLNCAACRNKNKITCKRCNETIMGPYNSVAGDTEGSKFTYHSACFLCIFCSKDLNSCELGGKTKDDRSEVYCKECYLEKFCEKCSKCPKPLIGAFFRIGGDKICKECCVCGSCGNEIGGQFRMKPDGKFQCVAKECPGNRASE